MEHQKLKVKVDAQLKRLLQQEDLDRDLKITKDDPGPKRFYLQLENGEQVLIEGHYPLSNLLQILAYAHHHKEPICSFFLSDLFQSPLNQLNNQIQNHYWDALTRNFSEEGLVKLLKDSKCDTSEHYWLYVSNQDQEAFLRFTELAHQQPNLHLKVVQLSNRLSDHEIRRLHKHPGLLALSLHAAHEIENPFVVPGGRFNEMYGWDSYYIIEGLVLSNRIEVAISMFKHLLYQLQHYGHILNANRSYYLQRSQPPFLTSIILLLKPYLSEELLSEGLDWAIYEYLHVWTHSARCPEKTLSRYFGLGLKEPQEVELHHFDYAYQPFALNQHLSIEAYRKAYLNNELQEPKLDEYFVHDRSMRESGHDTTSRLVQKSAHLYPVCLNALLYKYEQDIAFLIETYFKNSWKDSRHVVHTSQAWKERANQRKHWVNKLLWNQQDRLYYDYDFVKKKAHVFESATTFYPLFAKLASQEQADHLIQKGLTLFEEAGGLVSTTKQSRDAFSKGGPQRQWDYPFGWGPHQVLFWKGALNYGYLLDAQRLSYKWLHMIIKEARDYNGMITEKYDVVDLSCQRLAEYGNEGRDFSLYPKGGFAWTNASFLMGQTILSKKQLHELNNLTLPSMLF